MKLIPELKMISSQWFWPNLTYSQAEELVRAHLSSVFVVRKSESILGDLALTSGVGPRHNKKVKHHHIRSSQVDKGKSAWLWLGSTGDFPLLFFKYFQSTLIIILSMFSSSS